jgi:isopenicillin N synthase-like dioxygenase
MTLLVGATDSGLQLLDKEGNWVDVETKPDEIVIDTGDMMARITGDVLPSTVHRVINPDNGKTARYSMPFFLHPHSDAVLDRLEQFKGPDKIEPITAGEFLDQRLAENGLK